jgi:hypothetical protein
MEKKRQKRNFFDKIFKLGTNFGEQETRRIFRPKIAFAFHKNNLFFMA